MVINYYYSALTNSFYPSTMHEDYKKAGNLPADLVEIDKGVFEEFSQNKDGFSRASNDDGYPTWIEIPPLTQWEVDQQRIKELNDKLDKLKQDMIIAQIMGDDMSEMIVCTRKIRAELKVLRK